MHPEGGKILQKMIYAPSTQQQMKLKQQLTEFAIRNGVKVIYRGVNANNQLEDEVKEVN